MEMGSKVIWRRRQIHKDYDVVCQAFLIKEGNEAKKYRYRETIYSSTVRFLGDCCYGHSRVIQKFPD
jgi:hypothetical protein